MSKDLIEKARELDGLIQPGPFAQCGEDMEYWVANRLGRVVETFDDRDIARFFAESRTLLPALADLAESEGKRADKNAKHCAEMTAARNHMDEARALACFERNTAQSEIQHLKAANASMAIEHARTLNEIGNAHALQFKTAQALAAAEEQVRTLANGIQAYRVGGYTAAQVWENEHGKAVPR